MSELLSTLTAEQKLDIIFPLINKIPIHDDATMQLVSDINSIIFGDTVEGK